MQLSLASWAPEVLHVCQRCSRSSKLTQLCLNSQGELLPMQAAEHAQLQAKLALVQAKLLAWHRADERSRRLAQIPSIGPIGAVLLTMKTPAPEAFPAGWQFAAWIGLAPRDHSTAGRVRLGVMTRAGDEALGVRPGQGWCVWERRIGPPRAVKLAFVEKRQGFGREVEEQVKCLALSAQVTLTLKVLIPASKAL